MELTGTFSFSLPVDVEGEVIAGLPSSTGAIENLEGDWVKVWCCNISTRSWSGGVKVRGSLILLGLTANLEVPGTDENGEGTVALLPRRGDDKSLLTFIELHTLEVGLILNRPEWVSGEIPKREAGSGGCSASDLAEDASLKEVSSAKLLSSAIECDDPEGLRMPFSRGLSTEHRLNPYNRKMSAGFFGTESYTKSWSKYSIDAASA